MKAEQKKLLFRSSAAVAEKRWFYIMVKETGQDRFTVATITPEQWFASREVANKAAWDLFYKKFQIGFEYTKQEFIDFADTANYSLIETSQESNEPIVYTLDIGTVSSLSDGTPGDEEATISWTNANEAKNTKINIYLSSDDGETFVFVEAVADDAEEVELTGLTAETDYVVRVVPANDYGEGTAVDLEFTTAGS